uniref:Uncharacterized protein n=1 Tax=Astyanax mexicanus TaxID=7994 RepID=A0A8B9HKG8_ASTMX
MFSVTCKNLSRIQHLFCLYAQDLELYLDHRDKLALRKRGLLHKQWTECVWQPIQQSIKRRFTHVILQHLRHKLQHSTHIHITIKGSYLFMTYDYLFYRSIHNFTYTPSLKDPLCLQSRSRMRENRAIIRCQSGDKYSCCTDLFKHFSEVASNKYYLTELKGSVPYLSVQICTHFHKQTCK